MKFHIFIAAVVGASVLPPCLAMAQDAHAYALISTGAKETWFLDLKSVVKADPLTTFWALDVDDPGAGKISYAAIQYSLDCQNQRMAAIYAAAYAIDGTVVNSGNPQDAGAPIVPGSIGEGYANYICKGIDPFPTTGTIADTNNAIEAGHKLIEAAKKPSQPPGPERHKINRHTSASNDGI
jgi:hypothetical protein